MSKRIVVIHIENLDDGYILRVNGKTKAVMDSSDVRTILADNLNWAIDRFNHGETRDSVVTIEFEDNPPVAVNAEK